MKSLHNSIVLIGFKQVGKSTVGKSLAAKLGVPFFDLDERIECLYENQYHEISTCRQIMQKRGNDFFRNLETNALSQIINRQPSVISLGGGAPLLIQNQNMIRPCIVIHLTAPKEIVFERICAAGLPAFFDSEKDPLEFFNQMWDDREKIYKKIKNFSVENTGTIDHTVFELIEEFRRYLGVNCMESVND